MTGTDQAGLCGCSKDFGSPGQVVSLGEYDPTQLRCSQAPSRHGWGGRWEPGTSLKATALAQASNGGLVASI